MVVEQEALGKGVWPRVMGPLVTLLICGALWWLGSSGSALIAPAPLLCLAVAFASLRGRIIGGLVSAVFALAYVGFAAPLLGTGVAAPAPTDVIVLGVVLVALVFLISSRVDWLHARVEAAVAAADTAERRAALMSADAARRSGESGEVGRLHEALRASADQQQAAVDMLEAALDSVTQGVAVVDETGSLRWWNRSLGAMRGIAADRANGGVDAAFIDRDQLARAFEQGETMTRLTTGGNGAGEKARSYVEQYSPVETGRGERFVAITMAQVMNGNANGNGHAPAAPPAAVPAPAADRMRDSLVLDPAVIDTLRAPLAAIREYVWFMVAGPDQPRRRANDEYGSRVLGAAQQMDDRIEALTEYSRVLRGPVNLGPVPLGEAVRDALQGLEPGLSASGARVRIVAQPEPGPVYGDRPLLTLALTHLIGNAIKYVPADVPPRVLVWMEQVDGRARLSVEDNGIGIPRGEEARLFRLFERLPEAEAYPGNGVGLAVVRAAIDRMGGRVGVQSEPGWGTRFWIELRESAGSDAGDALVPALADAGEDLAPSTRPAGSSFAGIAEAEWQPI